MSQEEPQDPETQDDEQPRRPISRRVRRLRGRVKEAKGKRRARQLKRRAQKRRRRQRLRERTQPIRDELERTGEELSKLRDEFTSDDDKSEQAEESGGSFLANLLGAPSQVADIDGDGDDDLALFFGVDNEQQDRDGPDPFAAIEDGEARQRESEAAPDSPFTALDGSVFEPVAEFEEQFQPVADPFADQEDQQS
jgi:hypothetical protein